MRAQLPDSTGFVVRDGVRVAYDVYGQRNSPTVVLLPTWAIAEPLHWKAQTAPLARRFRVITIDGRGTGRSDRPSEPGAYTQSAHADDVIAVMNATDTAQAVVAGVSVGGVLAALLAARDCERIVAAVMIGPAFWSLGEPNPARTEYSFIDELSTTAGWAVYNQHAWRRDLAGFAAFFWSQIFTEPHSTKQIEDGVGWTLSTDADTLIATQFAPEETFDDGERTLELLRSVACPVLIIHGTEDAISPIERSEIAAAAMGADLLVLEGSGHCPQARDPIRVNQALLHSSIASRRRRSGGRCEHAGREGLIAGRASSTCRRRSGSVTRAATWRSPAACANFVPTSGWTGWPSHR